MMCIQLLTLHPPLYSSGGVVLYCTVLTITLLLHSSEYVVTCSVDLTMDITVSVYPHTTCMMMVESRYIC